MLTVSDVMTSNPTIIDPDVSIEQAIRLMKHHNCRQLPVVKNERLAGIITDRDVRLAMNSPFVLRERSDDDNILKNTLVRDCMTADPLTITSDAPASMAADLLRTYKFGGIPVVQEGVLVGIVSTSDILKSYIDLTQIAEHGS